MEEKAFREETTIVAPATPTGRGAVAIVRLSGPLAFPIARRITGLDPRTVPPRALVRCTVTDGAGGEIDAGMAAFFPGPASVTGEDVAEIHVHGNPVVVERTARAALALGAEPATPGGFSRRAFLNGKMDLTQAEGLADLIAARSEAAAEAALRQLKGGIGEAVGPVRAGLLDLLALVEAAIDFPEEEDVPLVDDSDIQERVSELRQHLAALIASYDRGRRVRDGATVAIAGVANVGKSRLLNRLLDEERAIVTEFPGTTRDYLCGEVVIGGVAVRLVDTAGLRETADPVEREGVRRSRAIIGEADVTLFLLDGSRRAHAGDLAAYGEVAGRPHILLLNKADLRQEESGELFDGPGRIGTLSVSALTGEGVQALVEALAREVAPGTGAIMEEAPLTRLRHLEAARKADEALARASEGSGKGLPLEFVAADVREAAGAMAGLTGEIAPDEVLDAVFGSFCIGK